MISQMELLEEKCRSNFADDREYKEYPDYRYTMDRCYAIEVLQGQLDELIDTLNEYKHGNEGEKDYYNESGEFMSMLLKFKDVLEEDFKAAEEIHFSCKEYED